MKTAAEYRTMADECFKWAREPRTNEIRASYLGLAQVWLNAASELDGFHASKSDRSGEEKHRKYRWPQGVTYQKDKFEVGPCFFDHLIGA